MEARSKKFRGSTAEEFQQNIDKVLSKLQEAGFRLNRDKCQWCLEEITYLGFKINSEGILPTDDKLEAIQKAQEPKNKTELQSYLGLLNFYRMFLPNASTFLEPLNFLLRASTPWKWSQSQSEAFQKSKDALFSSSCLVHFDPSLPIVVSADSSSYGIGACLAHVIDGKERPVFFASRTLNSAKRSYAQIEREALALVYALKKFHFYLYGHFFTLKTDHKPLLGIFSPDKQIPLMASGRIQRWCLMLQTYHFDLVHSSGKLLGNVDALSRLPVPHSDPEVVPIPAEWINSVHFFNSTQVNCTEIQKAVSTDKNLSQVYNFCINGWPSKSSPELQPLFQRRDELIIQSGCILWGTRVIIPSTFRSILLSELYSEHIGATRMKQLARSYFWWPHLDADIESIVQRCEHCLSQRNAPPKAELHPWTSPTQVWHRIHIDYCGPKHGYYFLVVIDATSKWMEVYKTKNITSSATISFPRDSFARYGIPVTLVSDNAPNFTSEEFEKYLTSLGIHHPKTAIYSPHMIGQAERAVQTFKNSDAYLKGEGELQKRIDQFLLKYRLTPHSVTGISPSELMFGKKIRCIFYLLHPSSSVQDRVVKSQDSIKSNYNKGHPQSLSLQPNDKVLARNYGRGLKWETAKVRRKISPVTYECEFDDGSISLRHQNQLWRDHRQSQSSIDNDTSFSSELPSEPSSPEPDSDPSFFPSSPGSDRSSAQSPIPSSHPQRVRQPPVRLKL